MKSQQSDPTPKTSCKDCIFAQYEDKTQVGCGATAKRLDLWREQDRLIEAYDDEKEFYLVKGFCVLYRPPKWNDGVCDAPKAREESSVKYRIYIDCTGIDEAYKTRILNLIQDKSYLRDRIIFTLYHDMEVDQATRTMVASIYRATQDGTCPKVYITSLKNRFEWLHQCALSDRTAHYINITKDSVFDPQALSTFNTELLVNLKRAMLARNGNTYIVSGQLYLFECNELAKEAYEANVPLENANYSDMIKWLVLSYAETPYYMEV